MTPEYKYLAAKRYSNIIPMKSTHQIDLDIDAIEKGMRKLAEYGQYDTCSDIQKAVTFIHTLKAGQAANP